MVTGLQARREVTNAIKNLKNNKAAGPDNIMSEMLKSGGEVVVSRLHALVVKIWEEEYVLEDLRINVQEGRW